MIRLDDVVGLRVLRHALRVEIFDLGKLRVRPDRSGRTKLLWRIRSSAISGETLMNTRYARFFSSF